MYGLPTLMVFKGGEKLGGSHQEGAVNKAKLGDYIAKHVAEAAVSSSSA